MAKKLAAVALSLGCLQAGSVQAVGLGELTLKSYLNEPLQATVEILDAQGLNEEQIHIRLATREDFDRMGVDRAYFLTSIQFDVQFNDRGDAIIQLSSDDPVLEPYLDFIIEARWPTGRLLREYTVLVDPPLFEDSAPRVSASQRVEEVEGIPAPDSAAKKSQAQGTSGTSVDVQSKSSLGPGEMPNRDFNAETTATPVAGSRYMIHRDDTLWTIAAAARPDGTSVHQAMLDIQRLNPNAFIDGNINRIKAGYIIYMPTAADISSDDLSEAMAEVRRQNEDWRAGRASDPVSSGPSLRISADPIEAADSDSDAGGYNPSDAAAGDALAASDRERESLQGQLDDMEQQVETLQRIVNLKDDQIAALQSALAEAGGSLPDDASGDSAVDAGDDALGESDTDTAGEDSAADAMADLEADDPMMAGETADASAVAAEDEAPVAAVEPEPVVTPAPAAANPVPKVTTPPAQEGGLMSYALYGLGALVLALLAFVLVRRRKDDSDSEEALEAGSNDKAFAGVQIKEQAVAEQEPEPEPEQPEEPAPKSNTRGYGERKHDEYASDVDAGDALAEADIYIAYGRYLPAIELLRSAVGQEPTNAQYRLKLLELYLLTEDRGAAEAEFRELEAIGDEAAIARGHALLSSAPAAGGQPPAGLGEAGAAESQFDGLEIEDLSADGDDAGDDLDLGDDFGASDEEDLVIAADANGMSTKLDLARAYLDMGDEDGARQILEEVVAEGSEEQKTEARELLDRID